jgi:hypothetical protein
MMSMLHTATKPAALLDPGAMLCCAATATQPMKKMKANA